MIGRIAAHARALEEARKQWDVQLEHELVEERGLSRWKIPRWPFRFLWIMVGLTFLLGHVSGWQS